MFVSGFLETALHSEVEKGKNSFQEFLWFITELSDKG